MIKSLMQILAKIKALAVLSLALYFFSSFAGAQVQISPDWFNLNSGRGLHTYSWQADQRHYEALAYNVSSVLFDLHNFKCFNSGSPEHCLRGMPRCPVPRITSGGVTDTASWDSFMDKFNIPGYDVFPNDGSNPLENLGYCTSEIEMLGQLPIAITGSHVYQKIFSPATRLTNRQGFFLDSYAAVPKAIRRSSTAIVKQMMNGIRSGLPSTLAPDLPAHKAMTCDGSVSTDRFKNFRNFAEYNGSDTKREIRGPMGFYDCAQREIGNNDYPSQGVEFTIRDRGNNPDFKCVDKKDRIYFLDYHCKGYAYVELDSSASDDFFRLRDMSDPQEAVVDLNKFPYKRGTNSSDGVLGRVLEDDNPYDNPWNNNSKSMFDVLQDFKGSSDDDRLEIVVAFYTEILDRTIYYAKPDEIFRRTVKFKYQGGPKTLPANYRNFISYKYVPNNSSGGEGNNELPNSYRNAAGTCVNLDAFSIPTRSSLVGKKFAYLDRLPGRINDYSGYVTRPFREINPAAPAGLAREALYSRTIEMNAFIPYEKDTDFSKMNDFVDLVKKYYPVIRRKNVVAESYGVDGKPKHLNDASKTGHTCIATNFTPNIAVTGLVLEPNNFGEACRVDCSPFGTCNGMSSHVTDYATCTSVCFPGYIKTLHRREWWTEDGNADKSGFLNVLTCSPDENMIALGKEDPLSSATSPQPYPGYAASPPALNPLSGALNPYCGALDGSNPPMCIRQGSTHKEHFNKYCIRYLVGKQVRRNTTGESAYGPFGNIIGDVSALGLGVVGGAMVCEDDEIYLKKASASVPVRPYNKAAKHPDSPSASSFSDYDNKLSNDAYFFKEAKDSSMSPAIKVELMFKTKFTSGGGHGEMTIPARAIGLGDPDARLPMLYGLCIRPKLELDYPLLRMGPLSLPFRNYLVDYMILNSEGVASGTPPNCP